VSAGTEAQVDEAFATMAQRNVSGIVYGASVFFQVVRDKLIALAAKYYPTAIRSTGVGWAMGMGRIGSFTGPLVVGSLVGASLSTAGIFVAIALPALLAAATSAVVGRLKQA